MFATISVLGSVAACAQWSADQGQKLSCPRQRCYLITLPNDRVTPATSAACAPKAANGAGSFLRLWHTSLHMMANSMIEAFGGIRSGFSNAFFAFFSRHQFASSGGISTCHLVKRPIIS